MTERDRNNASGGRHCMVVHAYYPLGETRVERQAQALLDAGVEVDVICLRKPEEARLELVDGVRVIRVPVRRYKGNGYLVQLIEYLIFFLLAGARLTANDIRKRYDVVQVHNLPDFLVFCALIPKILGAQVVLDLHDLMPEFYAERAGTDLRSRMVRLIRFQEKLSCNFAAHIITVTESWRNRLVERGIPPEKVSVVMNLPDDRHFSPSDRPEATAKANGLELIYHGNLSQRYGLDLLVHAVAEIRDQAPDLHVTIHGGGDYRLELRKLVAELDLEERITLDHNFIPTEDLARWILTGDLGIVPYRDGIFTGDILPTKLMEYASVGIPAVVARLPIIKEYFDESMVEFFTPGDVKELSARILALYRDRERLAELAANITRFNQTYNWRKQKSEYVQLIKNLKESGDRNARSSFAE